MTTKILDIIDFDRINTLLEGFNKTTGFVTAILDLEGKMLSKSGWRTICTDFHRVNAQTAKQCTVSDTELANKMAEGEKYHFYKCLNGLVDVAVPLVVNGEHIANLFSGQFFFEEPDRDLFLKQAAKYGFNNEKYVKALADVPVVSEERVKIAMDFLLNMTDMIAEMTMQRMEQIHLNEEIHRNQLQLNAQNEELIVAKESAEASEKYLNSILNNMGDPVFVKDDQSRILLANDAFCSLFELSRDQIIGKTLAEDVTPEERESYFKIDKQLLAESKENINEESMTVRGGQTRTISTRKTRFIDKNGGKFLIGVIRDITERKLAEDELRGREEKFKAVAEVSPLAIYSSIGSDQIAQYMNPTFHTMFGYSWDDVPTVGEWWKKAFPDEKYRIKAMTDWQNEIDLANKNHTDVKPYECVCTCKDGSEKVIAWSARNVGDEFWAFGHDLTERVKSENALKESEDKFRNMFEHLPVGKSMTGIDGTLDVNNAFCEMLGYSEEELKLKKWQEISHPDEIQQTKDIIQSLLDGKSSSARFEKRYIHKNGSVVWTDVSTYLQRDVNGEPKFFITAIIDITERKRAEEKIREQGSLVRIAAEKAKLGGWNVDLKENQSYWSDEVAAIHEMPSGYSPLVEEGINFYAPEWRERILKVFTDCAENGVTYDEEMEIITSTGKRVWIRTIGEALRDENGKIYKVQGAFQDISEKKMAEAKIREKDIQFRKLSANVPDMIFQFTRKPDGTYCVPIASEGIRNIFGCSPEDVLDDFTPIANVIYPDDATRVMEDIEYSAKHLTYFTCEFRVKIPGKEIQWIYSRSNPEKLTDGSITWYGFNVNFSERKQAQEALAASDKEFRKLAESMPQIVWICQPDGNNIYFNQQWVDYTGLTLEESYGSGWSKPFHPDEQQLAMDAWQNAVTNNGVYSLECRLCRYDGEYFWWLIRGIPVFNEMGEITKWFGTCTDIHDMKLNDVKISEQLNELRRWNEAMLNREERVMELKSEVNQLLDEFGKPAKYDSV